MTLFVNVISWVIVPVYVFNYISGSIPSSSLTITPTFIYVFGAVITGLQVLGALTEGMAPSIPLVTGSYIAVAYYIYVAVNGGTLTLTMAGTGVSLDFQPLFYLMVLPPLFSAIRTPMAYIAKENEATRPTSDSA
jgi:hypothetical protein